MLILTNESGDRYDPNRDNNSHVFARLKDGTNDRIYAIGIGRLRCIGGHCPHRYEDIDYFYLKVSTIPITA